MEEHQQNEQPGDILQSKSKIQRKHIDFLPLKQQRELREKEEIIKECIALQELYKGRLPRGESTAAMRKLKIKSRQTLLNIIDRYQRHSLLFPDEPAVNALIQNRGRPPKATLTTEEAKVALGLYLNTDWETVLEIDETDVLPKTKRITVRPRIKFVYNALKQIFPNCTATQNQLWHFLEKRRQEDPVLFVLARDGEKEVWSGFVPKTNNDVEAPNDRWQSDGRALPIVIRDDKNPNLTFTVTQIIVLDDYSRYVPAWEIIPRKEQTHTKEMRRVGVKGRDVRLVLATAFLTSGVRCYSLYVDNGSEHKDLVQYLKYLTNDDEPPIEMKFSKPGQPWGRGKVEVIGSLTDSFLRNLPGFVEDEDDLNSWRRAHGLSNLLTFSEFKKQLASYWKQWNTYAKPGQQSRKEIFENADQSSLPAPTMIRLAHLGIAEELTEVSVSDNGLLYRSIYYKPKAQDEDSTLRWMNAAGRTQKVPLYVLPLTQGENVEGDKLVIACLDGKIWEEVIPLKSKLPSAKKHAINQRSAVKQKKRELNTVREDLQAVLTAKYLETPKVRALTEEAILSPSKRANDEMFIEEASAEIKLPQEEEVSVLPVEVVDTHISPPKLMKVSPTNQDSEPSSQLVKANSSRTRKRKTPNSTEMPPTKPESEISSLSDNSLTEDPLLVEQDDDADIRERLRQLRAQRQHKEHS